MKDHGVKFKLGVTPSKMEKVEGDRIKVTFSDGSHDIYDTVLGAIGRYADTDKLGLENVGIKTNPRNKKIPTKFEQTETPNIYAVGDVMEVRLGNYSNVNIFICIYRSIDGQSSCRCSHNTLHCFFPLPSFFPSNTGLPGTDTCRHPSWCQFDASIVWRIQGSHGLR